jgi:hypothetical protein
MELRPGLRRLLLPPEVLLYSIPPISPSPLRWRWIWGKSPGGGSSWEMAGRMGFIGMWLGFGGEMDGVQRFGVAWQASGVPAPLQAAAMGDLPSLCSRRPHGGVTGEDRGKGGEGDWQAGPGWR